MQFIKDTSRSFVCPCNLSYLVNLNEVEKYVKGEGGYLILSDGSAINVSRNKKESLLKKLLPNRNEH